jgi:hypothetical protein
VGLARLGARVRMMGVRPLEHLRGGEMAKLEVADSRLRTLTAELPPGAAAGWLTLPGESPDIDPPRTSAPGAGRLGGLSPKIHLRTLSSISIGSFGRLVSDQSRTTHGVSKLAQRARRARLLVLTCPHPAWASIGPPPRS